MGKCSNLQKCNQGKRDCFAAHNDSLRGTYCTALTNTDFQNKNGTKRDCPFYKPKK